MSRLRTLLAAVFAVALLAGCSSDEQSDKASADQPPAQELLKQSAAAMTEVSSVAFALTTDGTPDIPIKAMNGDLLRSGDARGSVTATQLGVTVEVKFILLGEELYYNISGGYAKTDKSAITSYLDPSAILDPKRGIPVLLGQAKDATTDGVEDGSVKVNATLPADAVSAVGVKVTADLKGSVWIDESTHRLTKVWMELPGGSATLALSDYNANPEIKAP
ncbi:LppX_LprAFG lipoprotein [Actinocorallia sp. A-T 12471]|uniref:LppX_LprAFG lipoprotein n=1 Tax=Actinocorallia sp. A-T 12471 TaxID=3089813 RepID=UPI0029CC59F6|nr:LppX_LprAFG lipoprotein [Actinocorallia sp. A-T 12471]MDX6744720.1 LppX_LprAFG lipoprotein [Actinocorallia sp. A-T 12471]